MKTKTEGAWINGHYDAEKDTLYFCNLVNTESGKVMDVKDLQDVRCFITPSMNEFCYTKPVMHEKVGLSKIIGSDAQSDDGEVHFDSIDDSIFYYSVKNMEQVNDDAALVTFGDKEGYVSPHTNTSESFEFSTTLEKFDTFISHCNDEEGRNVTVVQYLGVETIDGNDYFVTWHTGVDLEEPIACNHPEIIQNSLNKNFGI